MHESSMLESLVFFLLAAVIAVPLFRRFKLGAILGYLIAGVVIGPQGLNLIEDPQNVLHYSEIGVVLLLFVIGLELNPEKLWGMRHHIAWLGGSQLVFSALLVALVCWLFLSEVNAAIVVGLALALSSTAFAIQLMAEKGILGSMSGRRGFAILLMQDLAVIPILFIVSSLGGGESDSHSPWWYGPLAVIGLLVAGRFLLNPLLRTVARFGSRESMTATGLLIVVGAAYLMELSGLSMGMGAFIAGIMLANSNFRFQLESDIEPFKGLTLGLFFIAIGMTLNLQLLVAQPVLLFALALSLMAFKAVLIGLLLRAGSVEWKQAWLMGIMLSQGGEFAFVIMAQALSTQIIDPALAAQINLIVGLSMALTAPLVFVYSLLSQPKAAANNEGEMEVVTDQPEVLILGFGRFGQITGRILTANHIPFAALDRDPEHIEFVSRFGNRVYFGDATRLDVLHSAGIEHAKTVLVAIDDPEQAVEAVTLIKHHYPELKVVARARNRFHHLNLKGAGADSVIREMMAGSLNAATETLINLGYNTGEALKTVDYFDQHDRQLLNRQIDVQDDEEKLIEMSSKGRKELERLFNQDEQVS